MSGFSPTQIKQIDQAIQTGRGAAASVIGQTYTVYRLSASSSNSILNGTPVFTNYPSSMRRSTSKKAVENTIFEALAYQGICDNTQLQIGDILVETGYGTDSGMFALAQKRPRLETIFLRVESNINITRPNPRGGQAGQQPGSGSVFNANYGGVDKANELLLTLTGGLYSYATSGSFAAVPCGLQPQNRVRSQHKPDFPTQVAETRYVAYLPLMPGVAVLENDILNFPNGDRYMVLQPYTSVSVGLSGWILIVEKMAV